MKKTKKSTKLSTKHGTERYQSRIQDVGDIDSKLKHIQRVGYDMNFYFGDFYKYLYGKNSNNNSIIVYEDILYIFDKCFKFLITTYPVPEKFVPTKKYFLSSTKRNIIDNISDYLNKSIVINYFNKKVSAQLLNMEIMFNNAYFSAITSSGELLNFSFDDIYDIVLSKNQQLFYFPFRNPSISESLASYFLKKDVTISLNGASINAKILNYIKVDNNIWFRIIEKDTISFINSADIYDIKIYRPNTPNTITNSKSNDNLYLLKKKYYKSFIRLNAILATENNLEYIANKFNFFELENHDVIHSTLGNGKIAHFIFNTIIVDFDNGESKCFTFPDCFEDNLLTIPCSDVVIPLVKEKIENYRTHLNFEKDKSNKWFLDIEPKIRLEEIGFSLSIATSYEEINCLIDEKSKIERKLYSKSNIGKPKALYNLNNNDLVITTQIEDLKNKNKQKSFITSFLGKNVIIFCRERRFMAKVLNGIYINQDLWIRIKVSSNYEFIKVSDIYDIRLAIDYINLNDKIFSGFERLNSLKRKIYSYTILICELNTLINNLDLIASKFNLLGIKNISVELKGFGYGTISYFIDDNIFVDFKSGLTRIFTFPYCFYENNLILNTSKNKTKVSQAQIDNTKNTYEQQIKYHKNALELYKIRYRIEELKFKLSNCEDGMLDKLLEERYSLEKKYYKQKLKHTNSD